MTRLLALIWPVLRTPEAEQAFFDAMLDRLDLREGMRVLEIGAGTGYNAALLKTIVGPRGRVVSVDLDREVARKARRALHLGGYSLRVVCGDGHLGYDAAAPYDRIVLTAGSASIAPAWIEQLREGGLLELPLRMVRSARRRSRPSGEPGGASTRSPQCPASSCSCAAQRERRRRLHLRSL